MSDYPPDSLVNDFFNPRPQVGFDEKLLLDWKWFDAKNIAPRYPFGHGLSYSKFRYGKLTAAAAYSKDKDSIQPTAEKHVKSTSSAIKEGASMYDTLLRLTVPITNTGKVQAKEVVQLYLSYPKSAPEEPPHVLRGFQKLLLAPGQTKEATFLLRRKDLSVWNVEKQLWEVPTGTFRFFASDSSNKWQSASTAKYVV